MPGTQELTFVNQHLLNHLGWATPELVEKHPPQFHSRNKQIVYSIICPKGAKSYHGRLEYTRWRQLQLPSTISVNNQYKSTLVEGFFDYPPPPATDPRESHWHVNFADSDVFGFYGSSLFAQDEMQCLEHPALCALREHLESLPKPKDPLLKPTRTTAIVENNLFATPVLVSGVERRAHIRTDPNPSEGRPSGLYGNYFACASADAVRKATTPLDERLDASGQPYFSNIIAMAAPRGVGKYTAKTLRGILVNACTAFTAASMEALVNAGFLVRHHDGSDQGHTSLADPMPSGDVPRVKIHTGNWGCGAFGGNPVVMTILQTLAAQMAQVELVYHVQGTANKLEYEKGIKDLKDLLDASTVDGEVALHAFIDQVVKREYKWGVGNGT